jgi:uncharacterized protein (DUF433 family)
MGLRDAAGAGFNMREAAALSGLPLERVAVDIRTKIIAPARATRGTGRWVRLTRHDVLYFAVIAHLAESGIELMAQCRTRLWQQIKDSAIETLREVAITATLRLDVRDLCDAVLDRLRLYRNGLNRVQRRATILDGAAVFRGTRIPIAPVGAMLARGETVARLREAYPDLAEDEIRFAALYAAIDAGDEGKATAS